jgi:hypothetical protein
MNKLIYWWLGTITCVAFMFLIILNVEIDLRKRQEADIKQLHTTIEKLEFSMSLAWPGLIMLVFIIAYINMLGKNFFLNS